jgi:hypothetical protein
MDLKQFLQKLNHYFINHLKIYTVIFSFFLVIGIGVFLYFNFYQTIISAKEIIILQADIAPAAINLELLKKVEDSYQKKLINSNFNWEQFDKLFLPIRNESINNSFSEEDIKPQTSF